MQALPIRPFSHPSYHCHSSGAQLAGASASIKKSSGVPSRLVGTGLPLTKV
jgi:hypothetical protein